MRKELFQLIEQQIQAKEYHGATLALFEQGKWQEYYIGTTDGEYPTKPGLVYDLASVSKVVGVGTICIVMINSGALDLDASLTTYYPAFHDKCVTLRQLLTHTSGLDPYIPNRDQLDATQLKEAMNQLTVTEDKTFRYTDVNFLLLGFMLEEVTGKSLDQLFAEDIFEPFGMTETTFGPRAEAVPTVNGVHDGLVHDPKARVLGKHSGSAGLFSTVNDMKQLLNHYMADDFASQLFCNYSQQKKERSIAWRLEKDNWLDHTGYTGPFIMFNDKKQAAIFLTNRTYDKDDRAHWIQVRDLVMQAIKDSFK
ncbi:serine hydrolase domain-containing protein [Streptococcus hongkongensis]|nr:beta-lactamase [Streptococcus uberis]